MAVQPQNIVGREPPVMSPFVQVRAISPAEAKFPTVRSLPMVGWIETGDGFRPKGWQDNCAALRR